MAEQITHDVVKEAQSMGGPSPIDDTANSTNDSAGDGAASSEPTPADSKPVETTNTNATSTTATDNEGAQQSEMAAGGAVADNPVDSVSDPKASSATSESKQQLTNGDSGEHSAAEEAASQQAAGEASGASDTDISRPGSVDQAKGHVRSNSVKKPAAFKSVSVTKKFLANSAVTTPSVRPGEKPVPAGQTGTSTLQTAKPRLVAKSGSGLVPRSSLSKVNGSGSGPDASKVWNKNQPIPPPPPKQFTDEELKQQYGIHLATRLQADEAGKEAKWADIDDDEDDWAPDTVQWMDGTKSTVTAAENQPPPEDPTAAPKEAPVEAAKPVTPTPSSQKPSATGGSKTILKPGAAAQSASAKSGLVLKGQPEKPTLVAKPSTSAPVKSPWATLPPVDKASPIQINPPVQAPPQSRYSQRDSYGQDAMPPPLPPAKEIAPDDFNRSWRDERGSRELFNSHSGRYEPVNEMRRGSVRDNFRQQPSVLQRPQDGPAEPSAAFQTSRTSVDGPSWGRRRNSSNVSGSSGRRMSIDRRAPDLPPISSSVQRRESHSTNGADGTPRPVFAQRVPLGDQHHSVPEQHSAWPQRSPNLPNVQPMSPYGSVGSAGPHESEAAAPPVQAPPAQVEDPVEVQKRLMAEKLERARLHKQQQREAEEKEEAEKKERLRKKLEAMGMGDNKKTKAKEQSPARSIEKSPLKDHALPAAVQSPPKPPVPTSEGEVAQYGMMKVHQPHPVKKPFHADAAAHKNLKGPETVPKPSPSPVKAQAEVQPKPSGASLETLSQPAHNLTRENKAQSEATREQSRSRAHQSESEARATAQNLKPAQPPPSAWASTPLPRQPQPWGANVWGPPQAAKDRALGNGTFDSSYNREQPRSGPQQLPVQPQPRQPSDSGLNSALKGPAQPPIAPSQPFAQQAMYVKQEPVQAPQATAVVRPGPIAPPAAKVGWGNYSQAIRLDDQALVTRNKQNLERMGGDTFRPEMRETYTDQQGKSQTTLHGKVGGVAALPASDKKPESSATLESKPKDDLAKSAYAPGTEAPTAHSSTIQGSHAPAPGRSSRFFPRSEPVVPASTSSEKHDDSPPPPPPETETHPAFAGNSDHPVVKMPSIRPVVKLPPSATQAAGATEAPVTMPPGPRNRLGFGGPLVQNVEWQVRFNSLFEKSSSTAGPAAPQQPSVSQPAQNAKPGALQIAPSSKAPLDVRGSMTSATVSLPNQAIKKTSAEDNNSDSITRQPAEALLEDREFGSLPIVKLPKTSHLAADAPPNTRRFWSAWMHPKDYTSKAIFRFSDFGPDKDTIDVRVHCGKMHDTVTKKMARKPESRSSSSRGKREGYSPRGGGGRGRGQQVKGGSHRTTPPAQSRSFHNHRSHAVAPTAS